MGLMGVRRLMFCNARKRFIVSMFSVLLCGLQVHAARQAKDQQTDNSSDLPAQPDRPVTMVDVIEMTTVVPTRETSTPRLSPIARFSPNGDKFVVLLRKGNLQNNANEFSLVLWRTADLFAKPIPERLLTMSSTSNRPAIQEIAWLAHTETL